jgi:nucleotide-binding universal stress UspA family protein
MFKKILVTIDLDEEESSARVLQAAREAASDAGAQLNVMTVVPNFGMSIVGGFFPEGHAEKMLQQAQKDLHAFTEKHHDAPGDVQHVIGHGNIYEEVLAWAKKLKIDLIVVGAHRPSAADYLLGPNSARIVRHANCSVLVVRD